MADRIALVELDPTGGRPVQVLDLNEPEPGLWLERDTLTFVAPARTSRSVPVGGRFGGSRQVGETHDNAAIAGTWVAQGATEADAIARLEALIVTLNDHRVIGRAVEFRPEGLDRELTGYHPLKGPATWVPRYRRLSLNSFIVAVELTIPVDALVEGLPMRVVEDWGVPSDAELVRTNWLANPASQITASFVHHTASGPGGTPPAATVVRTAHWNGKTNRFVSRYAVTRNDGGTPDLFARTAFGAAGVPVTPGETVGVRLTAIRSFAAAIGGLKARVYFFKEDGTASATTSVSGPGSLPAVGAVNDYTVAAVVPDDAAYAAAALLAENVVPGGVDTLFRFDVGDVVLARGLPEGTPVGIATLDADIPAYFDVMEARSKFRGVAHDSPSDLYDLSALDDWTVHGDGLPYVSNAEELWLAVDTLTPILLNRYTYGDVEVTMKLRLEDTGGTETAGIVLKAIDPDNYLAFRYQGEALIRIYGTNDGVEDAGSLTTEAITAMTIGPSFWLRARIAGDAVRIEHWTTDPELGGAPNGADSGTLAGADAAKYGAGTVGRIGVLNNDTGFVIEEYRVRPYVHAALSTPAAVDLYGIPGDAPARAELDVAAGAGVAPAFGLLGWTELPPAPILSTHVPFGLIEVAGAVYVAGFATSGSFARAALSGAGGTATLRVQIDPSTIAGDAWAGDVVPVELWLGLLLPSTAIAPRIVAYTEAIGGEANTRSYTLEHGAAGRAVVVPSTGSAVRRFTKVGTLLVDRSSRRGWYLYLELSYGLGSSGNIDLDYLFALPARRRLGSPTGKPLDSAYPRFIPFASSIKTILTDGRARIRTATDPVSAAAPSAALGGARLELDPGDVRLALKASSMVPDNPTLQGAAENANEVLGLTVDVVPRWRLFRAE